MRMPAEVVHALAGEGIGPGAADAAIQGLAMGAEALGLWYAGASRGHVVIGVDVAPEITVYVLVDAFGASTVDADMRPVVVRLPPTGWRETRERMSTRPVARVGRYERPVRPGRRVGR